MKKAQLFIGYLEESRPERSIYPRHNENWDMIFAGLKEFFDKLEDVLEKSMPKIAKNLLETLPQNNESVRKIIDFQLLGKGIVKIRLTNDAGILLAISVVLTAVSSNSEWTDEGLYLKEWGKIYGAYLSLLGMVARGVNFNPSKMN